MSDVLLNFTLLGYLDPGVSSLLMQALVGGSAGMMVLARYAWKSCRLALLPRRP